MGQNTPRVEDCGNCQNVALKMAPGEEIECEDCGRILVREYNEEPPNEIYVRENEDGE